MFRVICIFAIVAFACGQQQGQTVRQCSCEEVDKCRTDMAAEGKTCSDSCWKVTQQVTQRPEDLKKCFDKKEGKIDTFVDCFLNEYSGCFAGKNGPMIPIQSFEGVIHATEAKIRKTANALKVPGVTDHLTGVIQTAENFGACVKKCVRRRSIGTTCIKEFNCQPLLPSEAQAKTIGDKCTRGVNFKQEAGPLCNCALKAGVTDLAQYCPILALMGNKG